MRIAVIGGGISGLASAARLKQLGHSVTLYNKHSDIGGLIRCTRERGYLYHRVGGHVFNSRSDRVSNWFWSFFDKSKEFVYAERKAAIFIGSRFVNYPIENNIWQLPKHISETVINEILFLHKSNATDLDFQSLDHYFRQTFGDKLTELYFSPYNSKIWQINTSLVPLGWLDGKLPMPSIDEILLSNILRKSEAEMVHSRFFYPKCGGSQFIANRLSTGLTIKHKNVEHIYMHQNKPRIDATIYDKVIYTGDARLTPLLVPDAFTDSPRLATKLKELRSNSTSNALCLCQQNAFSWVYLPESIFKAHRIIMTGNFSPTNNSTENTDSISCTVEFSGIFSDSEMSKELKLLPFNLKPLAFNREEASYVIQDTHTRSLINELKSIMIARNIYLCGRFAEWEYYNMDKAVESALNICELINTSQE